MHGKNWYVCVRGSFYERVRVRVCVAFIPRNITHEHARMLDVYIVRDCSLGFFSIWENIVWLHIWSILNWHIYTHARTQNQHKVIELN